MSSKVCKKKSGGSAAPSLAATSSAARRKPIRYIVRTSKKVNDGRFRVEYLRCPLCGGRATRMVALETGEK